MIVHERVGKSTKEPSRRRGSLGVAALTAVLAGPATARASRPPEEQSELERRFSEGQRSFDQGDYEGAAQRWTALLERVPESAEDRTVRETVLLNVLQAHQYAYRNTGDIEHLRAARVVLDRYVTELHRAYGDDGSPSERVYEVGNELADLLAQAEAQIEVGPCLQPCLTPCLEPLPPTKGCGGRSNDPGLAIVGLLAVPVVRRRRREVLEDMATALPPDVLARLRARLRSGE